MTSGKSMIRFFSDDDIPQALEIHRANELPESCFPNLFVLNEEGKSKRNPLYLVKGVYVSPDGKPALMSFVKLTGEIFLLVDHTVGTPEERWAWMQEFKNWIAEHAWAQGLEQISCWIPPEIEESFAKRLAEMGFVKSPWTCYTLNLV
jgi:hypothetical protein